MYAIEIYIYTIEIFICVFIEGPDHKLEKTIFY